MKLAPRVLAVDPVAVFRRPMVALLLLPTSGISSKGNPVCPEYLAVMIEVHGAFGFNNDNFVGLNGRRGKGNNTKENYGQEKG
jgi:hypothetical protein